MLKYLLDLKNKDDELWLKVELNETKIQVITGSDDYLEETSLLLENIPKAEVGDECFNIIIGMLSDVFLDFGQGIRLKVPTLEDDSFVGILIPFNSIKKIYELTNDETNEIREKYLEKRNEIPLIEEKRKELNRLL